jgi:hypothetical protein
MTDDFEECGAMLFDQHGRATGQRCQLNYTHVLGGVKAAADAHRIHVEDEPKAGRRDETIDPEEHGIIQE